MPERVVADPARKSVNARGAAATQARAGDRWRESSRAPGRDTRRSCETICAAGIPGRRRPSAAHRCPARSAPPPALPAGERPACRTRSRARAPRCAWNTPVPQNGEPITKPHSAVPKSGVELPDLDDADRGVEAAQRDRVAGVGAGDALAQRPADESLEAFDRGRRWRNEARHLFRRQQRAQRRGVRSAQLAQGDETTAQQRQTAFASRCQPLRRSIRGQRDVQARTVRACSPCSSDLRRSTTCADVTSAACAAASLSWDFGVCRPSFETNESPNS